MSSMEEDRERPPAHFGDHPHGGHWSTVAHEGTGDSEDDYSVEGSDLRIMWDEGAGPLWSEDGLLPDDPEWIKRALGLSDSLVTDLLAWLRDMDAAQLHHPAVARLDQRAGQLADRLQAEVGSRFVVRYHG